MKAKHNRDWGLPNIMLFFLLVPIVVMMTFKWTIAAYVVAVTLTELLLWHFFGPISIFVPMAATYLMFVVIIARISWRESKRSGGQFNEK